MKTIITLLLSFCLLSPVHALDFQPVPEDCSTAIDDNGNGVINEGCPQADAFSVQTGDDIAAKFEDGVLTGYAAVADGLSETGNSVSRIAGTDINKSQIKLKGTATGDYYFWVLSYGDTTQSGMWVNTSPLTAYPNSGTLGSVLTRRGTPDWQLVCASGSYLNFRDGTNADCDRPITLAGAFDLYVRGRSGVTYVCAFGSKSLAASPQCPAGTPAPSFDYEVLDVASAPTTSADFDGANEITFAGFSDATGYTVTRARILWDKDAAPQRVYVYAEITDTDGQNGTATGNDDASWPGSSSVRGDSGDLRWRAPADLSAKFDGDTYNAACNVNDFYMDRDWTGGTSTLATNLNTTSVGTVVASTSWSVLCSFDAGGTITADTIGLAQFFITDRDAAASTSKFMFGTGSGAATDASQWGRFKWSSTAVSGSPDVTAPTVNTTAETNLTTTSATITFSTNEAGTAFVNYGTSTGVYTLTSSTSACTSSCVITLTGLSSGTTYYYRAKVTDAAGNTGQSAEDTVATTSAATANLFASATGSGTTCSSGSPCTPQELLSQIVAGQIGEFAGTVANPQTYQGAAEMLDPPDNKNGTQANPITIRCQEDGGCLLDGQNARRAIFLLNNDWWIIEGFNAKNGNCGTVQVGSGADNNILRRIVAWDTSASGNCMVWQVGGSSTHTGNLFEDVAGFGNGRKIFENFNNSNNTFRRVWAAWTRSTNTGPKIAFSTAYNSFNTINENIIATWYEENSDSNGGQRHGILANDQMFGTNPSANQCANAKLLGSIAYRRAADPITANYLGGLQSSTSIGCYTIEHSVAYDGGSTLRTALLANLDATYGQPDEHYLTRTTQIGGAAASIGSDWSQSGNEDVATVGAASNIWNGAGTTGARVCKRYVNGTLTTTPLFLADGKWPLGDRINAAITASGRNPNNYFGTGLELGGLLASIFGAIPAECKA